MTLNRYNIFFHYRPECCSAASSGGAVAVTIAIVISVLLMMLAFIIDAGQLYSDKSNYQNAVEAAALSGAYRMCDADPLNVAVEVMREYGVDIAENALNVTTGYYDVNNALPDFKGYRDFVAEGSFDYPENAFNNALLVELVQTQQGLTGLNPKVTVRNSAVAYLRRFGMMSGAEDGEIILGHNQHYKHGDIYAHTIKYPMEGEAFNKRHTVPAFENLMLLATGSVNVCPVEFPPNTLSFVVYDWENCRTSNLANALSYSQEIFFRPLTDDYMRYMKAKADVVYTPGQAGSDDVFWGDCKEMNAFFFDLTGDRSLRVTYYFDGTMANGQRAKAWILTGGPPSETLSRCRDQNHTRKSSQIKNVTFVTNADIEIRNNINDNYYLGARGAEQAIIITSGSLTLGQWRTETHGLTVHTGSEFVCPGTAFVDPETDTRLRIISDGDINMKDFRGTVNFYFGPPCPPAIAKLGRLEFSN